MISLRLDDELRDKLDEAARITGQSTSEFIRDALRHKLAEVLGSRLDQRLGDVIGSVKSGGSARESGSEFAELLEQKHGRRPRKAAKRKR